MLALIDADILVYRVGFTTQDVDLDIAYWRMEETIRNSILKPLNTEYYTCYLSSQDKSNFRYTIFPEYKANRVAPKPIYYNELREYLIKEHDAVVVEEEEADDRIGIVASQNPDTVICTIDKDLKQIPGRHFNFVKQELVEITPFEGLRFFYKQLLMGDKAVDNIEGVRGIGTKTSDKLLKDCKTELDMFQVVLNEYQRVYPEDYLHRIFLAGQLLKIRTKQGELWQFPQGAMLSNTTTELLSKNGTKSIPSKKESVESVENFQAKQDFTSTTNTSQENDK